MSSLRGIQCREARCSRHRDRPGSVRRWHTTQGRGRGSGMWPPMKEPRVRREEAALGPSAFDLVSSVETVKRPPLDRHAYFLKKTWLPKYRTSDGWVRGLLRVFASGNFIPGVNRHWRGTSFIPKFSNWWSSYPSGTRTRWSSQIRDYGVKGATSWAISSWVFHRFGRRVLKMRKHQ